MIKSRYVLFSMQLACLLSVLTIDPANAKLSHPKKISSQCVVSHVDNTNSGIAQTFQVDKKRVKIRTAPNVDSGIVKTLYRGATIEGIKESGWIKMIDGNYACAQYLKPIDPTPIAATQVSPVTSPPPQQSPVDPPASTITTNQPDPAPQFSINPQILIICLMCGSVVMVIIIAYNSGHSEGHTQGNTQGNTQGHIQGYHKGYAEGYDKASGEHTVEIIPVYYAQKN
jgi:hypothetical protein